MKIIKIIFILGISLNSFAQIPFRLPAIISNHAVLQQSSEIKLWGWGPGSGKVAIVCSWNPTDTIYSPIGGDCTWQAKVKTPKAGGSHSIEFRCNKKVTKIEDILLGEVWLCSGQSNMELPTKVGILDDTDVLKNCYNTQIRFFEVAKDFDKFPKSECRGEWKICDSTSLSSFSAVAYFFGRRLNKTLNVPVGLVGSYWGGTNLGSWCSSEVVENDSALQNNKREGVPYAPQANSIIYNAMIFPLAPYRLAGVIWYQGESNVWPDPETYGKSFANMIYNWRQQFETELPFYFVQIAPFRGFYPGIYAAYLREQQEAALVVPKTGMITIGDLAEIDVTDIHPRAKAGVGLRLANLALKEVYHKNDIQPYSPRFAEVSFSKNIARVKVNSLGMLKCKGEEIKSFEVAGSDRKFYNARAKIEKDGTIAISSKEVQFPVAVRYCFTNDQTPNLFDVNGLPLLPFRTDRWELRSSSADKLKEEFLYGPGISEPFKVKKDTIFRIDNLRSGSIKTDKGWSVQDFAHSFFNPNSDTITINLKMVCDNPDFLFANGQVGTFRKTYKIKPLFGITDNVFICPVFEKYKPNWPVSAKTNFTGSVEFSSAKPFYYYQLHETPVSESSDIAEAYFQAWIPCTYDEEGVWDNELNQFIIPYTNYWHNETTWRIGWHSILVINNNTEQKVIYTIRHIPFYGGQYNPDNGWITRFKEQVVEIPVDQKEEMKITLMELFGWSTIQMADMEGCLLISPNRSEATKSGTKMKLLIVPNKSGKPLHDAID